ncbi:MAG: TRAP transporter TatT component family protein [Polyangia bacterium]
MIRANMLVSSLLLLSACDLGEFTVNTTTPVLAKAADEFGKESDVQLAREAVGGQLKTADGFLASAPKNRQLLGIVARGYLEYTFGFVEDDLEAMPDDEAHHALREAATVRATMFYDRARSYAMRNLATFGHDIDGASKKDVTSFEAALARLPKAAAPGLVYGGMAWASAINLNRSDITRVAELGRALAMVKRAYALDPTFYNGAAAMTLGLAAASQAKALGGDPVAAKKYFDEVINLTGGKYLLAKLLEARFYAVQISDRALYEKLLHEVIDAPHDIMPSQRLANELAKRKAVRYLAQVEDFF